MTKKYSTKRALIASILALCMCFTMLIGTTFAWFTDSVSSSGNKIQTGNLDVSMGWVDAKEDPDKATYKDASEGAIFYNELWEPGVTEIAYLRVANAGSLALKYQLGVMDLYPIAANKTQIENNPFLQARLKACSPPHRNASHR